MRSLIIVPRYGEGYAWYINNQSSRPYVPHFIPMGLAYISSALKLNGYETDILNLNLYEGPADSIIQAAFSKKEYTFMLSGGLSTHFNPVRDCVNFARRCSPSTKIILGGGLVSSQPELINRVLQPDYLVIGEGENTIVELMRFIGNGADLSKIDGIGYRSSKGKLILTAPRKPIPDIDSIAWPDWEGIGLDTMLDQTFPSQTNTYDLLDYPRPYPISASRSCPYLCTFCFHPVGNKYRQRSIPNIMEELSIALKRYRINIIDIYDELFSHDKQRVLEFCREIKKLSRTVTWEVKWNCQMRVDTTASDEEVVEAMKNSGCYVLSLGLESYSHAVLKSLKKHITPQQIDRTLKICRRFEMGIQGNFIFGDKAETAKETLDYWKGNHDLIGDAISLGFIQPYPGTELYKHCLSKGLISDEYDFLEKNKYLNPINMSDTMTEQEFNQLKLDVTTAYLLYDKYVSPCRIGRVDGVYELSIKCPYCKIVSVYRNYMPPTNAFNRRPISCRNCRMRFWLVTPYSRWACFLRKIAYRLIGYNGVLILSAWRRRIWHQI